MLNLRTQNTMTFVAAVALCSAVAQAQVYDLSWYTIDGGGATSSVGGEYSLGGTIAQPDAGTLTGGVYTLSGGFQPGAGGGRPATGACCLKDGSCEDDLTEEECTDREGVQWHQGMPCGAVECPIPKGACCMPDGECFEEFTKEKCDANRGEWHEGKACNEVECQPGACNGNETFTRVKCKVKREGGEVKVKKVIVKMKKATPFAEYMAKLNTGQTVNKTANRRGKATFRFTRENKPGCGDNGVAVSTEGEDCILEKFDCSC